MGQRGLTRPGRWMCVIALVFWAAGFLGDRNAFLVVAAVLAPLLLLAVAPSGALEERGAEVPQMDALIERLASGDEFEVRNLSLGFVHRVMDE